MDQFLLEIPGFIGQFRELTCDTSQIARRNLDLFRTAVAIVREYRRTCPQINGSRRGRRQFPASPCSFGDVPTRLRCGSGVASMHLIGRKSDSSARASSFREARRAVLTNVA